MSLTEDIVKPTASEVRQMMEDRLRLTEEQLHMLLEIESERLMQRLDLQDLIAPLEERLARLEQILENMAEAQKRLRAATRQFDRY